MKIISNKAFKALEEELGSRAQYTGECYGFVNIKGIKESSLLEGNMTTCPALILRALEEHRKYYENRPIPDSGRFTPNSKRGFWQRLFCGC